MSDAVALPGVTAKTRWAPFLPAAAVLAYPFLLDAFHAAIASEMTAVASLLLLAVLAVPLLGLATAYDLAQTAQPDAVNLRARRFAYASMAAPPLFVFLGVAPGLIGIHLPDKLLWIAVWLLLAALTWLMPASTAAPARAPSAQWRMAHGISAALIACFVLFHLFNHLTGLIGPDTHAAVMKAGRTVYRASFIEPVLVALLAFQIASGLLLFWRWSALKTDLFRTFQIGSGLYLAMFLLAHMNSAFISARAVHHIETNWAWAAGLPTGLIRDSWNIRLLPHYAFGAFFVLGHLASGARVVMLNHGAGVAAANRFWFAGLAASALIATAIIAGLCGVRI
ncbi:MAG TPA: hypothetical protein VGI89_05565 [Rhizomicrobium sp.]